MNEKIIKFDESYNFVFLDDFHIKLSHPVSDYFLKLSDLSINLVISLKWIEWAYIFLNSLSIELENLDSNYTFDKIIDKSIQDNFSCGILEKKHVFFIDDNIISKREDLDKLLIGIYAMDIFNENTKIHLKMKINLREYLIIDNMLFPTFIKYVSTETFF